MSKIPNSGDDPATRSGDCGANNGEETKDWSASLILLMVVNTSITVFYLGFWLLGWWIPALGDFFDDAAQMARLFWPTVWFISFIISSGQ